MAEARPAGAKRLVAQSIAFTYAEGPTPHVETDRLPWRVRHWRLVRRHAPDGGAGPAKDVRFPAEFTLLDRFFLAMLEDKDPAAKTNQNGNDPGAPVLSKLFRGYPWRAANCGDDDLIGQPLQVDVYSVAERVRLYLNGKLIGDRPIGREEEFQAAFTVPHAPGVLKAVGVRGGKEVAESILTTAGQPARLRLNRAGCGHSAALALWATTG